MKKRALEAVQPSTRLTAFSCPHCRVLTTQHWRGAMVNYEEKDRTPLRFRDPDTTKEDFADKFEGEAYKKMIEFIDRVSTGLPSIGEKYERTVFHLNNVDISECYNCDKIALWVGDHMVWPHANEAPPPNADLPIEVAADYVEAGDIVNASPRGAAALLRLAIQKLCQHLGEPGNNINADIAALVKKGLDVRVQKMLDVVRVVGNNAVHPGEIDLRDDRATAEKLFVLVNMITDIMISQPKAIEEMYGGLGERALAAIEKRDAAK